MEVGGADRKACVAGDEEHASTGGFQIKARLEDLVIRISHTWAWPVIDRDFNGHVLAQPDWQSGGR